MKKVLLAALITLASVFGVSTVVSATSNQQAPSKGYVEYNIPNITSGTMMFTHVEKIFDMMPLDVREKCVLAYRDIIQKKPKDFIYCGVRVKHPDELTWEFYYQGASLIVRDVTSSELTQMFTINDSF
mgnify:CR=1 FL=1